MVSYLIKNNSQSGVALVIIFFLITFFTLCMTITWKGFSALLNLSFEEQYILEDRSINHALLQWGILLCKENVQDIIVLGVHSPIKLIVDEKPFSNYGPAQLMVEFLPQNRINLAVITYTRQRNKIKTECMMEYMITSTKETSGLSKGDIIMAIKKIV